MSKKEKDARQDFLAKMQTGINQVTKGLKVSPVGLEPPKGRNGAISSGSLLVDLITGGGWPKHRMTTIAGPSGVGKSTLIIRSEGIALSQGVICHHLDLEGAADDSWAKANNLDMNKYMGARGKPKTLYYIPDFDSGDDAFRYMSRVCDLAEKAGAGELDYVANVFFHDSLPASVPESLLENDEAGAAPRLALMLSEKLPMVRMKLRKANAAYVAINQIKLNPRAMFGCLHGDTKIRLVDGRMFKIREIVDQRIEGEVWSYDQNSKKLIPAKIKNWFDNGISTPEAWLSIETEAHGYQRGLHNITVTRKHKLLTSTGEWVEAEKLTVGQELMSQSESITNGSFLSFLVGTMAGDSGVNEKYNRGAMVLTNQEQPEYLEWKVKKLSRGLEWKQYESYLYVSKPRVDLDLLKKQMPQRNPLGVWDYFNTLSLAVWFMDDGCYRQDHKDALISVKRFKDQPEIIEGIVSRLTSLGYECAARKSEIHFTVAGFSKLSREIRKYVPECMQYKLNPEDQNHYVDFDLEFRSEQIPTPVKIRAITEMSAKKARTLRKFDLEVEGTHNYVACSKDGGLVVHNSPEYEPGGSAPTFFADLKIRLDSISKPKRVDDDKKPHALVPTEDGKIKAGGVHIEDNPDGTEDRYVYTKVKTIKNRVFPPKKEVTFRIWSEHGGAIGGGIDPVWDTIHFFEMIGMCQFYSKDEVDFKGKVFNYYDLKKEILVKPDLYQEALSLLDSGRAFELYFNRLRGGEAAPADEMSVDPELEQELDDME